jgi:hypothetical protein
MVEKLKSWWKDNVESVEKMLKVLRISKINTYDKNVENR